MVDGSFQFPWNKLFLKELLIFSPHFFGFSCCHLHLDWDVPPIPLFLHFNKIVSSDFLLSSLLETGNILIKFSLGRKWIKRCPQGGGILIQQKDNQQQEASNLPQPLPFSPLPTQSNVSCGFQVNHVFGSFHAANFHFTHSSKFFFASFLCSPKHTAIFESFYLFEGEAESSYLVIKFSFWQEGWWGWRNRGLYSNNH